MDDSQRILQEVTRYNNYLKQIDSIFDKLNNSKGTIESRFSGVSANAMLDDFNKLLSKSRNSSQWSIELQRSLKRLANDVENKKLKGKK